MATACACLARWKRRRCSTTSPTAVTSPRWRALFDFKRRALDVFTQIFPEPHAALLQGIVLGYESGIPKELKDAFNATGTSHIVAISGFNVALLAGLFEALANRLFGAG